jgi:hypothetical protein
MLLPNFRLKRQGRLKRKMLSLTRKLLKSSLKTIITMARAELLTPGLLNGTMDSLLLLLNNACYRELLAELTTVRLPGWASRNASRDTVTTSANTTLRVAPGVSTLPLTVAQRSTPS